MNQPHHRHHVTLKRFVYEIDGMLDVHIERDVHYGTSESGPLAMDLYYPAVSPPSPPPVVIIVAGYPDVGVPMPLGCNLREMEMTISLAQLIAASGLAAVAYSTSAPSVDAVTVLDHVARQGASLGVDGRHIGLWAMSGNVPNALSVMMRRGRPRIAAAVLSNGYLLDSGSAVAEAAQAYGFANPIAGRSVEEVPADVPLLIVRSGRDEFRGVNETIDRFAADALARNLPLTLINHATAPHGFELDDDSSTSRFVIGQMLAFLLFHLSA